MPITTTIHPALPPDAPTATAAGSEQWEIAHGDEPQLDWFHADVGSIRAAVERFSPGLSQYIAGVGPAEAAYPWVNSSLNITENPTDPPTHLTVTALPDGRPNVAVQAEPQLLSFQRFHNALQEDQKFKGHVSLERHETVGHSWSKQTTIGSSLTVEVGIAAEGISAKTSATISQTETAGEGGSKTSAVATGQVTEIDLTLAPGEWGMAAFGAWAGHLTCSVPITAQLTGALAIHLRPRSWWSLFDIPSQTRKHVIGVNIPASSLRAWALPAPSPGASMVPVTVTATDTLTVTRGWFADTLAEALPLPDDTEASARHAMAQSLRQASPGRI